jgi:hypothetical protein
MSFRKNPPPPITRRDNSFPGVFENLPAEPETRLDALAVLNHRFRLALAGQLQPVVRALLQETPPDDDGARKELAHRLNYILRDAGLAILDPDSKQASTIVASPYRLQLQSRATECGRRTRSRNVLALPPLKIIEHTRQEPFATWQKKVTRDDPTSGHGR